MYNILMISFVSFYFSKLLWLFLNLIYTLALYKTFIKLYMMLSLLSAFFARGSVYFNPEIENNKSPHS